MAFTTGLIIGAIMFPRTIIGPHHGIVVLVILPFMVGVGHIERVGLSVLKPPLAVGVVMVVVRSAPNTVGTCVQHCELVEVPVALATAWR